MAGTDELGSNSNNQTKRSGSSPRGDQYLEEAETVLSQAGLSEATVRGGSGGIEKSSSFDHKLLSLDISSRGSSPRGDLYLEETERVLSRADLSEAAGFDDPSLEQIRARRRCVDLLRKAAIEYCSANLLANAAQCYERAAELQNIGRNSYISFTILSKASKCYKDNLQYDKAVQCMLKLINMATESNDVSRIADFNCKLADIYVLKPLYSEARKHYEIAYNLYRVEGKSFWACLKTLEKQANLSILQNDFEAAAKYFVLIFDAYYTEESLQYRCVKYFVKACLSFLVDNLEKSSYFFKEKEQNAKFSRSEKDNLAIVLGIINAVKKKNYDSFKSIVEDDDSCHFDLDHNLRDIVWAIEKKYFLAEVSSGKKKGKLPAADDNINFKKLLDDETIKGAYHNKSKNISNDNSPSAPALPRSTDDAPGEM